MKYLLILIILTGPTTSMALLDLKEISSLTAEKTKLLNDISYKRQLMSRCFDSEEKIRSLVKKFSKVKQEVHSQENLARKHAKKISGLSLKLKKLKSTLSKRMKTIYKLNQLGYLRILINNFQAGSFDKNMLYFKKFISKDLDIITNYNSLLKKYNHENKKLKQKIKVLLAKRKSLKRSEAELEKAQKTRFSDIKELKKAIASNKNNLRAQVSKRERELLNSVYRISFFEKKGRLPHPIQAKVLKPYGLYNDKKYSIRFLNKGITYFSKAPKPVTAVFDGTISFVGKIPGHGNTIIINHKDQYFSVYSKLNSSHLSKGDEVSQGQYLGNNLKISKNNHQLYFEIRHYSEHLNPLHWIQRKYLAKN